MLKRERHQGFVTVRILAIRSSSDGMVADVELAFESMKQERLCTVGQAVLYLEGPKKDLALKCGPVWFDLARLDVPGLDEKVRAFSEGRHVT